MRLHTRKVDRSEFWTYLHIVMVAGMSCTAIMALDVSSTFANTVKLVRIFMVQLSVLAMTELTCCTIIIKIIRANKKIELKINDNN